MCSLTQFTRQDFFLKSGHFSNRSAFLQKNKDRVLLLPMGNLFLPEFVWNTVPFCVQKQIE